MKKVMLLSLVIAFSMFISQAKAHTELCEPLAAVSGSTFASSALFGGAVGFGALATWAIATNQTNPLCQIGMKCYSEYPGGANHVYVQAQTVNYTPKHVDDFDHPVMRDGVLSSF